MLRKYHTAYRSIPQSTTGRSPADLLFNRKDRGKIPDLRIEDVYDQQVHDRDVEQKAKTKYYADTQRSASLSSVEIGDEVVVQQDKTNKLNTALNPTPFKVVNKNGNSLVIESPTGKRYFRNTSHVKQYVSDATPQQEPDILTTPASLPTEEPATGLLDW